MNILAVDTALAACSVAILTQERSIARQRPMERGHAEALMPMLADAMAEARLGYPDIDRFVVTVGPGTFTGVRVGVAAIRGLALVAGHLAIGVTTLEALAETGRRLEPARGAALLVAMDARRGEIYAQTFAADGAPLSAPAVSGIEEAVGQLPPEVSLAFGSGAPLVAEAAAKIGRRLAVLGVDRAPDPLAIARIGRARPSGAPPKPLYLRPPDARPQEGAALARR